MNYSEFRAKEEATAQKIIAHINEALLLTDRLDQQNPKWRLTIPEQDETSPLYLLPEHLRIARNISTEIIYGMQRVERYLASDEEHPLR